MSKDLERAPDLRLTDRAPTMEERVASLERVVAGLVLERGGAPDPEQPRLAIELEPGGHRIRCAIPKNRDLAHQLLALLRDAVEEAHGPSGRILTP